jgi:hypothetical protein
MDATTDPCPVPVTDVKDAGSKRAPSTASGLAVSGARQERGVGSG